MPSIAIIGMACCYPDANSPEQLWENVLAQRVAFRRMPAERLRVEDYFAADPHEPDKTYAVEAAVIEGYEFDRVRFNVAGSTFRSADLVHWLALDIAAQALADAGFDKGEAIRRETTGVVLGNTLTGEFSRASTLRLRWPFVRRVVESALTKQGWDEAQRRAFLADLETQYKSPFPPVTEETLAGGLSNTIAGRICNYFDLQGGGYTVDGACSSSLLAVATACSSLAAGDLEMAIAGGVDLSLDPFELVGFAKTSALAPEKMKIYDRRSAGFTPGEGCGMIVLMREADARAQGRRIYATIRGWGISSDGNGGITRPTVQGHRLAVQRAYQRAEFGIDSVAYLEGHGTGTNVGDATELRALSKARRESSPQAPPAVIGSIKANIGHTKAAAGIAGLIKATMALHKQILPPTSGCEDPHAELTGEKPALQVLDKGRLWPSDQPLRAGVSAMGFGGINTHVALENLPLERRQTLSPGEYALLSSSQEAELFLFSARDKDSLRIQVQQLATLAPRLSRAEMADLAAQLEGTLEDNCARAAIVASTPAELSEHLHTLDFWLQSGSDTRLDTRAGIFFSQVSAPPQIGFLFPGQGSPSHISGGALRRRFDDVEALYGRASLVEGSDPTATEVAQPAIITASLAALQVLERAGVKAEVAIGNSLGELAALYWAGAFEEDALLRIVRARGQAMSRLPGPAGKMASLLAGLREVEALLNGEPVVIAALNSPQQTVISGEAGAVDAFVKRVQASGVKAINLRVSHAFHSPLMTAALPILEGAVNKETAYPLQGDVLSTVTGGPLDPAADLKALLCQQLTSPVRFTEAFSRAPESINLWIEVGPGHTLSNLISEMTGKPVIAIDAGGRSLKGLLQAVGAAFALGAAVRPAALFAGRFTRPFDLDRQPRFFMNPCELAPVADISAKIVAGQETEHPSPAASQGTALAEATDFGAVSTPISNESALIILRQLIAERAELPPASIREDSRLLSDLHLNSITVAHLLGVAARHMGIGPLASPTDYADATVSEIAEALEALSLTNSGQSTEEPRQIPGVDAWVRAFTIELAERSLPSGEAPKSVAPWKVLASEGHPLAEALQHALDELGGGGVAVCLPSEPDESHLKLLLEGAREIQSRPSPAMFLLVQHRGCHGAFARSLHQETPGLTTCVIDVPIDQKAVEWVIAEVKGAAGYHEAHYDDQGRRHVPLLRHLALEEEANDLPFGPEDVLLVTGGGKGITAECAIMIARQTQTRLVLMGLSIPEGDEELSTNLARMTAAGLEFIYLPVDVNDAAAVAEAVGQAVKTFGPVTGILHGAAINIPQLLRSLDETQLAQTVATKVQGLRNLLAAVDTSRVRVLITFGSIIARMGLPGEAHYGLANEWLTRLAEDFQREHPQARCLSVEWSVWSGVGMAQRFGGTDSMARVGITPIAPDIGVAMLRRLLATRLPRVAVVVTGRYGDAPTLEVERPELPLRRFLEYPRVYYPGVEIITDAVLSADTDAYLDDHRFAKQRLLPAVMGLEAMAQVAMALACTAELPVFENAEFLRPIAVPATGSTTIRIAALIRKAGQVEVAIRSQETAFQADHFRVVCRFEMADAFSLRPPVDASQVEPESPPIHLDPEYDLYNNILFHGGRFQLIRRYLKLASQECLVEVGIPSSAPWFGGFLPSALVLGDAAVRDTAIHAIQACIPHATLLPIGFERLVAYRAEVPGATFIHARERAREDDVFVYDIELTDEQGNIREQFIGLRLKIVQRVEMQQLWAAPLLGPYVERRLAEMIPGASVRVLLDRHNGLGRQAHSDQLIRHILGPEVRISRRYNGKPEVVSGLQVSLAHTQDLTLAVAGREPLGCDLETVVNRTPTSWLDLLGNWRWSLAEVVARESGEDTDASATRIWMAMESLKKAGMMTDAPLLFSSAAGDGWVILSSGLLSIATLVTPVRSLQERLGLAILVGGQDARL